MTTATHSIPATSAAPTAYELLVAIKHVCKLGGYGLPTVEITGIGDKDSYYLKIQFPAGVHFAKMQSFVRTAWDLAVNGGYINSKVELYVLQEDAETKSVQVVIDFYRI